MRLFNSSISLRLNVILQVLPIVIFFLLGSWYVASDVATRIVEDQVHERLDQEARQSARALANRLTVLRESAQAIAGNELIINGVVDTVETEGYIETFFQSIRIPGPEGARIGLTDYRGRPIASNGLQVSGFDPELLDSVMAGQTVLELTGSRLTILAPVLYQGAPEGTVFIVYEEEQLAGVLAIGNSGEATAIVDGRGEVIYTTNLAFALIGEAYNPSKHPGWLENLVEVPGFAEFSLVSATHSQNAFVAVSRFKRIMLLAVAFGIVAVLGGIYWATYLATRPLAEFTRSISKITGTGDLSNRIDAWGPIEFRSLARSFNEMISRLENTTTSRNRVDKILASMNDMLIVTDRNGRIESANQAACEALKQQEAEIIGVDIRAVFKSAKSDDDIHLIEPASLLRSPRTIEAVCIASDSEEIPVHVSGAVMMRDSGQDYDCIYVALDVSERRKAEETIRRMAMEDALTGLANRAEFQRMLRQSLAQAKRQDSLLGVMLIDLDNFKDVNDTLGHPAGDALLKVLAKRLTNCVRESDMVARLGGDEFAVVAADPKTVRGITVLAQRIIEELSQPIEIEGKLLHSGASIGITVFPYDDGDVDHLVRNADLALYRAKSEGRNRYQLFDYAMHEEVLARRSIEGDLRQALDRDQLRVLYQPQMDLRTGRVVGAEALLRWHHPERGIVSPGEFIPIAEACGLIVPMSEWLLRKVCQDCKAWSDQGLGHITVAMNVSPIHFRQDSLTREVSGALEETGLPADLLELEITESMVMEDGEDALATLNELKGIGVGLAIDDFGTGYSSLNHLKQFPVDRLKIDRSFVRDVVTDWDDAAISSAVINLGHNLNLKIVAEGVESEPQLSFLLSQGCDEAQGFYFSKPIPEPELREFIRENLAKAGSSDGRVALQKPSEALSA